METEKLMSLAVDTTHEYTEGSCRLRVYRHVEDRAPTVVLVTDWHHELSLFGSDENRLAYSIEAAYDWITITSPKENSIFVVHSPRTYLWTPNGNVLVETWNRLRFEVGMSRHDVSRAWIVGRTGHELDFEVTPALETAIS